jgi:chromosomal replication initiator protein
MPLQNFRQNTSPIGRGSGGPFIVDNFEKLQYHPATVPPIHKKTSKTMTEEPTNDAGQGLWQACVEQLGQDLPEQQFNTWIKP